MNIITEHIFPPIQIRSFDWIAYYYGTEERGQWGHGRTEQEAIEDLRGKGEEPSGEQESATPLAIAHERHMRRGYESTPSPSSAETGTPRSGYVSQRFVDRIVARAQNSAMGLGDPEPGKSYNLANYAEPTLEAVGLLLVNAHFEKYDLTSLMVAALEEMDGMLSAAQARIGELEKDRDHLRATMAAAIARLEESASPFDEACRLLRAARSTKEGQES